VINTERTTRKIHEISGKTIPKDQTRPAQTRTQLEDVVPSEYLHDLYKELEVVHVSNCSAIRMITNSENIVE